VSSEQCWGRYTKLPLGQAEKLWKQLYNRAGATQGPGARHRTHFIIGGLVLPMWTILEQVLSNQAKPADRKLNVIRLQTTGPPLEPVSLITSVPLSLSPPRARARLCVWVGGCVWGGGCVCVCVCVCVAPLPLHSVFSLLQFLVVSGPFLVSLFALANEAHCSGFCPLR
jgi:hypothetical protein